MNDAARCLYLVCYDIANPRRLSQVHKFLLGYKAGGQKSFFECWLTPSELKNVRHGLHQRIENGEDRAHIFQMDARQRTQCLGIARPPHSGAFMIV